MAGPSPPRPRHESATTMTPPDPVETPSGHTPEGGVLVGSADATQSMVLFEDPQCPYCRQFEERNGSVVTAAVGAGALAVEYRMRCFLGPESVRADNALALAAEVGRFDELRLALFAAQPPEGTGGFTINDLLRLGAQVGLAGPDFVSGVRSARYAEWVLSARPPTRRRIHRGHRLRGSTAVRSIRGSSSTRRHSRGRSAARGSAGLGMGGELGEARPGQESLNVRTWLISSCRMLPKRARASPSSCSPWAAAR